MHLITLNMVKHRCIKIDSDQFDELDTLEDEFALVLDGSDTKYADSIVFSCESVGIITCIATDVQKYDSMDEYNSSPNSNLNTIVTSFLDKIKVLRLKK